jgi:cellulose 1,4-beta-cellobiosidase
MGNTSFIGPELIIDTGKPVTVVTQFASKDRTNNGLLS